MSNNNFVLNIAVSVLKVHCNNLLSRKTILKRAERRVIREVHRAYADVPYYRKKYDEFGVDISSIKTLEDLSKLPIITKDEIREQFPDGIVSKKYNIDDCHYSATTGSTGRSLPFVFSMPTFAWYIATGMRLYTLIGYRPWHKLVYIKYTPIEYPKMGPFFRTQHIPSTISIEEQIEMLRGSKPDLLIGYASLILEIAQKLTPEDLKLIKPKFIGLNSELSTKSEREFVSQVFNCPVYDEYSTEETWMVASTCKEGNYHVFADNVWAEYLDKDGNPVKPGEEGEIYLTTLRSPAMPFIRYRIGDLVKCTDKQCTCGLPYPLIEEFNGRADDSFILPSGKYVSSIKILNTFTKNIKKYLHLMEEFKVIQQEPGLIVIQFVKGKEFEEEPLLDLIHSVEKVLGEPVTIRVDFMDSIPGNSIKRKAIESWVDKKESRGNTLAASN
ncbi:MAG: phenylacetate--CoA ligase family protein [Ignavibacteriales bacterium]